MSVTVLDFESERKNQTRDETHTLKLMEGGVG